MTEGKRWQVGATLEYHHLIRQNDLAGAAVNRNLVYLGVDGRWEFTSRDRITVEGGIYRRTFADEGETGYRLDDSLVYYTHRFSLPQEITMRVTGGAAVPTSLASQRTSLYFAPRVRLQADRTFGTFTIDARVIGDYYITKYASAQGGNPNSQARLALVLALGYDLPFYKPVSFGISGYTGYYAYYDVKNGGSPNQQFFGAVERPNQPLYQDFGWEMFARYLFPAYKGILTDFTVTLAEGDPTIGYTSVLHDGVRHPYAFFRQVAEVYFALGAQY